MKKLVYKVLSEIPPFSWLLQKLINHEREIGELNEELRVLAAEVVFSRVGGRLRAILDCLKPKKVIGFDKIRVGAYHDGGYIMLNDFASTPVAYSLGIADEVSWDVEIANRGIPVKQFDYSIKRTPVHHPLFTFYPRKVANMTDILASQEKRQILKIDIEGAEWDFFDKCSIETLALFNQIVGEFHFFSLYHKPEWQARALRVLQKLNETHQLIHIHGNNGGLSFWANQTLVPDLFELTFILRSEYRFEDIDEKFPGSLDAPNLPDRDDFILDTLTSSRF
jgi:hypothetical protein